MSTEDWAALADREAARIIASAEVGSSYVDYALVQKIVALAWLEGYKTGTQDAVAAISK